MFTDVEYTYLKNLIDTYVLKGDYTDYLAYTYTDISSSYSYDYPDMYVIFAKSEIQANNNTFTIPSGSIKIAIDSNSASRNGVNGDRFAFTESEGTVYVEPYEFIYTNAVGSKYADVLAQEEYKISQDISYNIDKAEYYVVPLLICVIIMMLFLKWCFPNKGGKA